MAAHIASDRPKALDNGEIIIVNGIGLCVETFGARGDPAILLIHGAATSMQGWDDEFYERLSAGGRFVIRYDQRDTGRSVSYPPGQPGYAFSDLIDDTAGLLEAFELESAHFVGLSMGGGIAMGAALRFPNCVASLTLIGTSPGGPDLQSMSEDFLNFISRNEYPNSSDREAVIDHVIAFLRVCLGGADVLDEVELRDPIGRDIDRTTNIASSQINHFTIDTGAQMRDRLDEITVPTLVIHGEHDPIFRPGHAETLQREISDAELLLMKQTGHVLLRPTWNSVAPALLAHTSGDPTSLGSRNDAD